MKLLFIFSVLFCLVSCNKYVKIYSETGQLQEKYKRDRKKQIHGIYKMYFSNKQLLLLREYKHGKIINKEFVYYDNGQLRKIANYERGEYNGEFIYYYENGVLEQEGVYKDAAIDNNLKTYYKSGQLKEVVAFENGEENGDFVYYHPNGKIKSTGRLKNGDNYDGLIMIYDEEGTLIQKKQCEIGECIVVWQIVP